MNDDTRTDGDHDAPDVMATLRRADPEPVDPLASTTPAAQALFQEITTMTDTTIERPGSLDNQKSARSSSADVTPLGASRPSGRNRFLVAAAAAVAIAGGAVIALPGGGESAQAAVLSGAEATEAVDSGRIQVSMEVRGGEDVYDLDIRFDGDAVDATGDFDGFVASAREVDGVSYFTDDAGRWRSSGDAAGSDGFDDPAFGIPGARADDVTDGLTELAGATSEIERIDDSTFEGSTTLAELRSLEQVPSGISLLAVDESIAGDLAVDIRFVLDGDGRIARVDASFVDPSNDAGSSATTSISTTYSEFGTPQTIEAPADATPADPSEIELDGAPASIG